jgi:hypothetical protein
MVQSNRRTISGLLKDLLIYCAIGVSIALLAIALGIHNAKTNLPPGSGRKWVGFFFMTLLVFVNVFRSYKSYWRLRRFWEIMGPISILHLGFGLIFIARLGTAALISFVIAGLVEYFALTALLDEFLIRRR